MNVSKKGKITVQEMKVLSNYKHRHVLSLASYHDSPFVTGSNDPPHSKTELLNIETLQWETKIDFPDERYFS